MSEPGNPQGDGDRPRESMEKRRRAAVELIAERNAEAHRKAKKVRQESDRRRSLNRGPNPR